MWKEAVTIAEKPWFQVTLIWEGVEERGQETGDDSPSRNVSETPS